jgi:hypothetical protein
MFHDFYGDNQPDRVSSLVGAHDHSDMHDGNISGSSGEGLSGHASGQSHGRR